MSYQTKVTGSEVGKTLQSIVDDGYAEEILMGRGEDGEWMITADSRKFWTALLTPSEVRALQSENQRLSGLLSMSNIRLMSGHVSLIDRFRENVQTRLNKCFTSGDPTEAKGLQQALVLLTESLLEDRFHHQHMGEQCLSCMAPVSMCGCEWSKQYFEWVKRQNELGEQWLKEREGSQ